jgi:hypothetical protein
MKQKHKQNTKERGSNPSSSEGRLAFLPTVLLSVYVLSRDVRLLEWNPCHSASAVRDLGSRVSCCCDAAYACIKLCKRLRLQFHNLICMTFTTATLSFIFGYGTCNLYLACNDVSKEKCDKMSAPLAVHQTQASVTYPIVILDCGVWRI